MAQYILDLGEIAISPETTPVLNLTLAKDGVTNSYVLEYNEQAHVWLHLNGEQPDVVVRLYNDSCAVRVLAWTSDDVGDEYTINLSLPEEPTQAFKEAVEEVIGALNTPQMPTEFANMVLSLYSTHASSVIAAAGQTCRLPAVVWDRTDAVDKEGFDEYYNSLNNIIHNPSRNTVGYNPYYRLVTGNNSGEMKRGPEYISQAGYVLGTIYSFALTDADNTRIIQLSLYVSLVKVLT